jgi:outer membrane protein assembly factor BamE (lipoprotein component of BamABCDE complex)
MSEPKSGKILVAGIVALIAVGIALFAIRPKPEPALAANPDVNRNASRVLPGKTYESREKIDPGMTEAQVAAALGAPIEKAESRGATVSARWNYLYSDGNLVVKLRDGRVTEIETTFY